MNKSFNKNGFTLAEVLITLGIIGVVAALTIPTLINNTQKQDTISKYKKIYSTLTQAVKLSSVDNGDVDNWDWSYTSYDPTGTNLTFMNTYLAPYLLITKACTNNGGCWATIYEPNGTNIRSSVDSDVNYLKYVLADGTTIGLIFRGDKSIEIIADTNGPKAPNIMGKDAFRFILLNKASSSGEASTSVGGLFPCGYGKNITSGTSYNAYGCSKSLSSGSAGDFCGIKLIRDGYEIKSDYPW